jgi:hypothetical protein
MTRFHAAQKCSALTRILKVFLIALNCEAQSFASLQSERICPNRQKPIYQPKSVRFVREYAGRPVPGSWFLICRLAYAHIEELGIHPDFDRR